MNESPGSESVSLSERENMWEESSPAEEREPGLGSQETPMTQSRTTRMPIPRQAGESCTICPTGLLSGLKPWARRWAVPSVGLNLVLIITVIIFIIVTIAWSAKKPEPCPADPTCPENWIGYLGKCYYFSQAEGNWTHSQNNCSVLGASLAAIDTQQEMGQTPAAPGSDGAESRDPSTAECSTRLERFRSQLCPPAPPGPAGGSGCKLCPTDWQLRGDKCYWVSKGSKTWSESHTDCSARGSQLPVIWDQEELEFLKALTGGTSLSWVGLSVPSPEKAWTWLDGSRLDQTQLPVSGPAEGNSCGAVKGNRIRSDACSSAFQWICQRDAVLL